MNTTNNFERRVLSSVDRYGMIDKDDSILVALSGGADSVSLLLCLSSLFGKERLAACHVNHMIRGADANSDELFCSELCKKLGIRFFSTRIDIPSLSKERAESSETVARDERYKYFNSLTALYGFSKIATAHTLSDNAETLIFNICRGTNTCGLCGIPPVRDNVIRPLCELSRQDVEAYLKEKNQDFCHDKTNDGDDYTRNIIRHNIIPQLKKINPSFEIAAKRLCDSARADKEFFESCDKENLSLCEINSLPDALKTRHIRNLCKRALGERFFLSAVQTGDICREIKAVADGSKKSSTLCLCDKKYARISDGILSFCSEDNLKTDDGPSSFDYFLHDGKNIINEEFAVFLSHNTVTQKTPDFLENGDIVYNLYKQIKIPSDIISGSLRARSRLFGDSYRAGGMTRKLGRMLIDKKLTEKSKRSLPVICDDDGILFVPGFPVSDRITGEGDILISVYKTIHQGVI